MTKIFIDGGAGTTGLVIHDRLKEYDGITVITLPEELRKDEKARANAMNQADVVFLCLPDSAAIEAVNLITNENTVVIDTSTAHRTNDGWTYGFPELTGQKEKIKNSKRIANPGCHASGFISLVAPLTQMGVIKSDVNLTCFSITGYTGGGKKMIAEYENDMPTLYSAPRQYGLSQKHKHVPEIMKVCNLKNQPAFCPIVSNFPRGMEVTVSINGKDVIGGIEKIKQAYKDYYKDGKIVYFNENADENGFLSANAFANKDSLEISVHGTDENILLVARFDNLGKGASGAAIENMNIVLGLPEEKGLTL
ncbi:MAG: N-acetyl-gamma-glutamyl-phosphate reductase [Clostridia bacterium]|nr:N-acetyl-gamma-glutamyl-phosphate reductase [Clostridia bacterium]